MKHVTYKGRKDGKATGGIIVRPNSYPLDVQVTVSDAEAKALDTEKHNFQIKDAGNAPRSGPDESSSSPAGADGFGGNEPVPGQTPDQPKE